MITQHTLDDTLIGQVIGTVSDGFIVRFELQTGQWPVFQLDAWNVLPYPNGSFAAGGRLILRDRDGQGRRLLNFNPSYHQSAYLNGASLRYAPVGLRPAPR